MTIKLDPQLRPHNEADPRYVQINPLPGALPVQPVAGGASSDALEGLAPGRIGLGTRPASSTQSNGPQAAVKLQHVHNTVADGGLDSVQFGKELEAMAVGGMTPAAQSRMIDYLSRRNLGAQGLCSAAKSIRETLFDDKAPMGPLRRFFNSKGVKLYGNDKVEGPHALDKKSFKVFLDEVQADGVIDKREARQLLGSLREVVDRKDLQAAQWELEQRLQSGELRFADSEPGAPGTYETQLQRTFDEKLGGELNIKSFRAKVNAAREAGFSPEHMAELRAIMEKSKNHPDALFAAQRSLETALQEAHSGATQGARKTERTIAHLESRLANASANEAAKLREKIAALRAELPALQEQGAAEATRLDGVRDAMRGWVEPLVANKIDRKAERDLIRARVESGELSRANAHAMMAAVATSSTPGEYAQATMSLMVQLAVEKNLNDILEAWAKNMEEMHKALEMDERRAVKRYMAEKEIQRVQEAAKETEVLAERAFLLHGVSQARNAQAKAATASEAVQLGNDEIIQLGGAGQL